MMIIQSSNWLAAVDSHVGAHIFASVLAGPTGLLHRRDNLMGRYIDDVGHGIKR